MKFDANTFTKTMYEATRKRGLCTSTHIFEGKKLYCELGPHRSGIDHKAVITNEYDYILIQWNPNGFTYTVEEK